MKKKLTQKELMGEVAYDPDTGIFTRLKGRPGGVKAGSVAGSDNGDGYLRELHT